MQQALTHHELNVKKKIAKAITLQNNSQYNNNYKQDSLTD